MITVISIILRRMTYYESHRPRATFNEEECLLRRGNRVLAKSLWIYSSIEKERTTAVQQSFIF